MITIYRALMIVFIAIFINFMVMLSDTYNLTTNFAFLFWSGLITIAGIALTKNHTKPFKYIKSRSFQQNLDAYLVSGVLTLLILDAMFDGAVSGDSVRVIALGLIYIVVKQTIWIVIPPLRESN